MANIDVLQIEIESSSLGASKNIKELGVALGELKKNGKFNTAVKNMNELRKSLQLFNGVPSSYSKIIQLKDALSKLSEVKSASNFGTVLKKLAEGMRELGGADVSTANQKIKDLAPALAQLSEIKAGGIGTMINGLAKIKEVTASLDKDTIEEFAKRVGTLTEKLSPLSEKMATIKTGFSGINSKARSAGAGAKQMGEDLDNASINFSSFIHIIQTAYHAINNIIQKFKQFIASAVEWDGVSARFGRGFGRQAQETYTWIQRLNEEMGINVQQFMQYSSIYATMLTGFGVAQKDASKMALGYAELTYDIWAGYNDVYKSFADAAEAVKSAIAGEVEPVRRAGFTIVEATLEQTAANHGLKISLESATEAQKSYLRYLTLVDQAHAQGLVGTYAKELDTAEGLMRTASQQVKSLSQAFGSLFLPILVEIMPYFQAFVELLTEAVHWLASMFGVTIQSVDWSGYNNGVGSAVENTENLGGAINGATEAAKKLKNATLGFDELNVISPPTNSGSSGNSGSGSGFNGLDVDSLWDDSIFANIGDQVDSIKKKLEDWLPVIGTIGSVLGTLALTGLIASIGKSIEEMNKLGKVSSGLATLVVEAVLVFAFADNYLETGNFLYLLGEALTTAASGYLAFKAWGVNGVVAALAVSIAAQLVAITLNLADGSVKIDDLRLWVQSAFAVAMGGAAGGWLTKLKWVPLTTGEGISLGVLAAISLTLAAINIGDIAADGKVTMANILTGLGSVVTAAGFGFYIGGVYGAAIGAAVGLLINVVGATIATKSHIHDEIEADIAEALTVSGGFTLEDVSVEIGVKLSAITKDFGEFEQYRGIIDGTRESINNVTTGIDNMAGAIEKDSTAFKEYVPQIIASIATLETETRAKLEAIRENLISALAGGLGEGYENVGEYVNTVNGVIDDTMTRLDELEVILGDSAKVNSREWIDAWSEYKTLIGEATTLTEDFSKKVGGIDWSTLTTKDGTLDSGALKAYFGEITTAMGDTKEQIETYYSGIDTDLRTLRDNAARLGDAEAVVKLDSLIDTNKANWDNALGEVSAIAQDSFDQLQRDVMFKAANVLTKAQDDYKNMSWWEKLMYPNEEAYVKECLSTFQSDYINPISTEMSGLFEELGIDGSVWSSDAMATITDALFDVETHRGKNRTKVKVLEYKNSVAGSIIEALKAAGQDAKPYALQVANNIGLDLGNGLGDQYSLVYDKTTGAVTGVKDAVNDTTIAMTPDLKAAMTELGIDMSDGLATGVEENKPNLWQRFKTWWKDFWDFNRGKDGIDAHSPSRKAITMMKDVTDGLVKGLSLTALTDRFKEMWGNVKTWWDTKKEKLKTYTPSFGSIKDALSNAWTEAKNWWKDNVSLSIPSLSLKVTYSEASGWKKAVVDALGLDGWPKLSFAADGGIFDAGSLVWAGEHGAEIVANAGGGKTGVMNVQQMSEAVYEGVYSAVVAAMRDGGGNGGAQSVNVYLDGKQITAAVEKQQKSRGATLMTGGMAYGY